MSLRVSMVNEMPPGGWRYPIPETGKLIGPFPAYRQLLGDVKRHYGANGLLAPADLERRIHDWMCHQLHPSLCQDYDTQARLLVPPSKNSLLLQFNAAVQGTLTMGEWFITGRLMKKAKLVEKTQANGRAFICATCPHNVPVGRCAPCVAGKLKAVIARIVGNSATDLDASLNACDLCGCSLKAKVWFPLDLLRKHMTAEHLAQFPDFCWLRKEAECNPITIPVS